MKLAHIIIFLFSFGSANLLAQADIAGKYMAVDDRGGEPKSIVEVYHDGRSYRAKVLRFLPAAITKTCDGCTGSERGRTLIGMDIFWGLTSSGKDFRGGEILDPRSGRTYDVLAYLEDDFLVVRGYIKFPIFGLSLRWKKVES